MLPRCRNINSAIQWQVEGDQVETRDQGHHPREGEKDQHTIFIRMQPFLFDVLDSNGKARCRAHQQDHLGHVGESIVDHCPVEKGSAWHWVVLISNAVNRMT